MRKLNIGIIGAGSFGTVITQLAATNQHQVSWWLRSETQRANIAQTGFNPKCRQYGKIPQSVRLCSQLPELCQQADLLIIALPAAAFTGFLLDLKPQLRSRHMLLSAAKGISAAPLQTSAQALEQAADELQLAYGVLSGPNIASEIAAKHLTGTVVASASAELRQRTRTALATSFFHVFENDDCYGVELGGILKNIYAIAAGIVDELQFGVNSKSLLLVRAMTEMLRLADKLGARRETFFGLAGMGDLIATSMSRNSRNYQLGCLLARGLSLEQAQQQLPGVAEGIRTLQMVHNYATDIDVAMPLATGLYQVMFNQAKLRLTFWRLLKDTPRLDVEC